MTNNNDNVKDTNTPPSSLLLSCQSKIKTPSVRDQEGLIFDSSSHHQTLNKQNNRSINSGLSAHIVQNYSILAQEITAPLNPSKIYLDPTSAVCSNQLRVKHIFIYCN
jgi:hypothetical protein